MDCFWTFLLRGFEWDMKTDSSCFRIGLTFLEFKFKFFEAVPLPHWYKFFWLSLLLNKFLLESPFEFNEFIVVYFCRHLLWLCLSLASTFFSYVYISLSSIAFLFLVEIPKYLISFSIILLIFCSFTENSFFRSIIYFMISRRLCLILFLLWIINSSAYWKTRFKISRLWWKIS